MQGGSMYGVYMCIGPTYSIATRNILAKLHTLAFYTLDSRLRFVAYSRAAYLSDYGVQLARRQLPCKTG